MDNNHCWENYGQNMSHKLVIKWEKFDHEIICAKYGQNMAHKMGKIWARFGPNREQGFSMYGVYSFVGVFVMCTGHRMV